MITRAAVLLLAAVALATVPACASSDDDAATIDEASSTTSAPTTASTTASAGATTEDDAEPAGAPSGEGLCALLDVDAAVAVMGEPLSAVTDTASECKLAGEDGSPTSLVVTVVASDGADRYAQQRDLLGVDEELSGIGDEGFRSGNMFGVLDGDRFVLVTFAAMSRLPAEDMQAFVADAVTATG